MRYQVLKPFSVSIARPKTSTTWRTNDTVTRMQTPAILARLGFHLRLSCARSRWRSCKSWNLGCSCIGVLGLKAPLVCHSRPMTMTRGPRSMLSWIRLRHSKSAVIRNRSTSTGPTLAITLTLRPNCMITWRSWPCSSVVLPTGTVHLSLSV